MKFFAILSLGLVAVATAQVSTTHEAANSTVSTTTHSAATSTQSLSPEQTCLAGCARTDICCQAACVKVPCPNAAQANATTECAASCPQGNGTAGETEKYASCQSSCISSLFFATATSGATYNSVATNAAGSTTGTGGIVAASTSGASGTLNFGSGSTASATGSSATTTGAASHLQLGVTGAGILGLVVMGFAL